MRKIVSHGLLVLLLTVPSLQQAYGAELTKELVSNQWHAINIPCSVEKLTVKDIFTGLQDGSWELYGYDGTTINDLDDQLVPDIGYWFRFNGDHTVNASVACNSADGFSKSISPQAWFNSSNIYNTAITLADITLDGKPIMDSIEAELASPLWVYRDGAYFALTESEERVESWESFWLYNDRPEPTELVLVEVPRNAVKAFPTAEGAGASAVGGRGGKVMQVTNLNDAGPGSLRACAESTGPRNCVFRLGGTITLQKEITVDSPYLTIAGQTAPGGGITIRMNPNVSDEVLNIKTHDVIVRYLRLRPGGSSVRKDNQRGLTIANKNPGNVYNIIIDHCSIGWASDETAIAWYDARDITFQWSIFHEGFKCANHTDTDTADCSVGHSKGLLVGSEETADHPASGDISIHHNIFAHHEERGPRLANGGVADVVNNVAYNMRYSASQATNRGSDPARRNFVSNLYIKGPSSESDHYISPKVETDGNAFEIFVEGNISPLRTDDNMAEELAVKPRSFAWRTTERHSAEAVTTYACASLNNCEMKDIVLARAGTSFPARDAVDKRIIAEIESFTGQLIDAQAQAGCFFGCSTFLTTSDYTVHGITDDIDVNGYPVLEAGVPYIDNDNDGMDDEWETRNGLNPLDSTDHVGDINRNGYTNLEDFLNSSDGVGL